MVALSGGSIELKQTRAVLVEQDQWMETLFAFFLAVC
jgi:hypothetical protein